MNSESVDVLVIGAGPAGCIAAATANKLGLKVRVVEKLRFPRFVIGESLLPRVMDHLDATGLLPFVEAAGFQKKFGAKFVMGDQTCDFNFSECHTPGWTWTWQVPRAQFDTLLTEGLRAQGIRVDFGIGVETIDFNPDESSVTHVVDENGNASHIQARFIIDGSGYGRVIPKLLGLNKPSGFDTRKSHFTHLTDPNRPTGIEGNRITVVVHGERIWIWVIPFSNGLTSVGYVGDPEFFSGLPLDPDERMRALILASPFLSHRFKDCEMKLAPRTIEGYAITSTQFFGKGFVTVGNATEFLDPVFSSGVTFAMESGATAARVVAKKLGGQPFDFKTEYVDHMMQGINTFRTFVNTWYNGDLHQIFFAKTHTPEIKKQICSVLAGYVWDKTNPVVLKHEKTIANLARVIRISEPRIVYPEVEDFALTMGK
jgi:flavin-dependent dehydrogenase